MPVLGANIERLTEEHIPAEQRGWVGAALVLPLNKVLDLFRSFLNRGISLRTHINAQIIERKFTPPTSDPDIASSLDWSAYRYDTPLTLSGPVLGVQVLAAYTVDGAGHDLAPVGNLPTPVWREVVVSGSRHLRLVYQYGLATGASYRLILIAWGQ